jgi:hypothetical protein
VRFAGLFGGDDVPKKIFETACTASILPELLVEGRNISELASSFLAQIKKAAALGDYTKILSPNRNFQV